MALSSQCPVLRAETGSPVASVGRRRVLPPVQLLIEKQSDGDRIDPHSKAAVR